METLLIVIGVLGLGALAIATWVFVSAARRYVRGDNLEEQLQALESDLSPYYHRRKDRQGDRRKKPPPQSFPIVVNGERIEQDRRVNRDRRRAA